MTNYIQPLLPSGVKDILPVEAKELKLIKKKLAKQYESAGYREVFTPAFEYLDVLSLQAGERIKKEMFKFFDDRGELLALRPDMTTSIARLVSQKLKDTALPLRLFYQANVFRQQKPLQGQPREFWQSGIELIGGGQIESDAQIVKLLVDSLKGLGLTGFKVGLSNIAFIKSFLEGSFAEAEQIKQFLSQKNLVAVDNILSTAGTAISKKLKEVINLKGLDALAKAKKLSPNKQSDKALDELMRLADLISKQGYEQYVTYDFSLVPDFDYYTGLVFEVYVENLGAPVASGGRYDNLLSAFGWQAPAAGFAFGLERLHEVLVRQKKISGRFKDA